ncbi:hypothetical protein [Marinobacter alexandrii]
MTDRQLGTLAFHDRLAVMLGAWHGRGDHAGDGASAIDTGFRDARVAPTT